MSKGTCPVVDEQGACVRPIRTCGLCNRHYLRLRRTGDPSRILIRNRALPVDVWFWSKLTPPNANGCREWTGARNDSGYGMVALPGKRIDRAHRVAWELTYGAIPDGLVVRHYVCDNPPCAEPTHLLLGTHADNVADRQRSKGR